MPIVVPPRFRFIHPSDTSGEWVVAIAICVRVVVALVFVGAVVTVPLPWLAVYQWIFVVVLIVLPTVQAVQIWQGRRW